MQYIKSIDFFPPMVSIIMEKVLLRKFKSIYSLILQSFRFLFNYISSISSWQQTKKKSRCFEIDCLMHRLSDAFSKLIWFHVVHAAKFNWEVFVLRFRLLNFLNLLAVKFDVAYLTVHLFFFLCFLYKIIWNDIRKTNIYYAISLLMLRL